MPFGGLVAVGRAAGRERVQLVEEQHAGVRRPGAAEQLPHRPLRLADVLVEQLRALRQQEAGSGVDSEHGGEHEDGFLGGCALGMQLHHNGFCAHLVQCQAAGQQQGVCRAPAAAATLIEMKFAPDSLATALASSVLPQPAVTPIVSQHRDNSPKVCTAGACAGSMCLRHTRDSYDGGQP
jgi:hypothetical protein